MNFCALSWVAWPTSSQPVPVAFDGGDRCAGVDGDASLASSSATRRAEVGVDGGQHLRKLLDHRDDQAAGAEGFGHLQPDVAGAHDDRRPWLSIQGLRQRERVGHRVQDVHTLGRTELVEAGDRRPDRHGPGADDELVVGDQLVGSVCGRSLERSGPRRVHGAGGRVEPQLQAGRLQVAACAVGQVAPVGHVTRDVVRDAADGEVRERVSRRSTAAPRSDRPAAPAARR